MSDARTQPEHKSDKPATGRRGVASRLLGLLPAENVREVPVVARIVFRNGAAVLSVSACAALADWRLGAGGMAASLAVMALCRRDAVAARERSREAHYKTSWKADIETRITNALAGSEVGMAREEIAAATNTPLVGLDPVLVRLEQDGVLFSHAEEKRGKRPTRTVYRLTAMWYSESI